MIDWGKFDNMTGKFYPSPVLFAKLIFHLHIIICVCTVYALKRLIKLRRKDHLPIPAAVCNFLSTFVQTVFCELK